MKFLKKQNNASYIQLKLKSVYRESLILYIKILKLFFKKLFVKVSFFTLPKTRKRVTLLKSPHVNKTAKEQFEIFYYQVLVTVKEPVELKKLNYFFLNKPKSIQLKVKL